MKKRLLFLILLAFCQLKISAKSSNYALPTEYETTVTFPAGFAIGDYIEFLKVSPKSLAGGYYQISIAYTRGNIAAAATHVAALSHANPAVWRETGRLNNNPYTGTTTNFTVDCNTEAGNSRFRIRAIHTAGVVTDNLTVYIKVTSLNINNSFTALNLTGNDASVSKFLPMTADWDLYVGDVFTSNGALLAIKAIKNGNVGIGTPNPDEKLTVKGKIHTQEVKVDLLGSLVPDYVFANDYKLKSLQEVEDYIKQNSHLPEIPSAKEIEQNGLMLAEMNMSLLKKIEELTLYSIEQNKKIEAQAKEIETLKNLVLRVTKLENELARK
ncbi:tail fiber protein [Flavobacterium poyangense]|uniref:tail fiber protein n=1 Tax=Flavobacterium poyangense TaxID=2204302 RepID=UPI001FB893A4|nr:tail fiber protein [Flavobacterium sp. JXAS1]